MNVLMGVRGSGKTARVLEWMRNAPEGVGRVMVCVSADESMRVYRSTWDDDHNPTDLESWQFVSLRELFGEHVFDGVLRGRRWQIELSIDNLDVQLQRAFRWPVALVTMSKGGDR